MAGRSNSVDFMSLPSEIHVLVASHLPYPDLLSLRFASKQFLDSDLIKTTKKHRVGWLLERARQGMSIPMGSGCDWSCDNRFVHNNEVISMIRRRRRHLDCLDAYSKHGWKHCLVLDSKQCPMLKSNKKMLLRLQKRTQGIIQIAMMNSASALQRLRSWYTAILALVLALAVGVGRHVLQQP